MSPIITVVLVTLAIVTVIFLAALALRGWPWVRDVILASSESITFARLQMVFGLVFEAMIYLTPAQMKNLANEDGQGLLFFGIGLLFEALRRMRDTSLPTLTGKPKT